jgi:hypothetical protein
MKHILIRPSYPFRVQTTRSPFSDHPLPISDHLLHISRPPAPHFQTARFPAPTPHFQITRSPFPDHPLPSSDHRLSVPDHPLFIPDHPLFIPHHLLFIPDHLLPEVGIDTDKSVTDLIPDLRSKGVKDCTFQKTEGKDRAFYRDLCRLLTIPISRDQIFHFQ